MEHKIIQEKTLRDFPHLYQNDENEDDFVEESEALPISNEGQNESRVASRILELTLKLGKNPITPIESKITEKLLVKVKEAGDTDEESFKESLLDLVILLDCSGSMAGFKLDQVKKSLLYLIEIANERDRIALIAFNSESVVLNSLRCCSIENKLGRLFNNIKNLTAMGGTNIVGALRQGMKVLAARKTKNEVASLFLLSDGQDSYEMEGLSLILEEYSRNIGDFSINTFGFGDDYDSDVMKTIAQRKLGNFYYIENLENVDEAFVDCFAFLKSIYGPKGMLEIKLIPSDNFPDIKFGKTYGHFWTGEDPLIKKIKLGNFYLGLQKNFLAEIDFGKVENLKNPINLKIAEAEVIMDEEEDTEWTDLTQLENIGAKIKLFIKVEPEGNDFIVSLDEEVESQYLRVAGVEILNNAKNFATQGKFAKIKPLLDNFRLKLQNTKMIHTDVVMDNLDKNIDLGLRYISQIPQRLSVRSKKPRPIERKIERYFDNNAYTYMNEQSAPGWHRLYTNSRQSRYQMKNKKRVKK